MATRILNDVFDRIPWPKTKFDFSRLYSTTGIAKPILHIPPGSNIFAFGAPSQTKLPLICNVDWQVHEGEAWAVVSGNGARGKETIFKTLLGQTRIAPPTSDAQGCWAESGGLYPFLAGSSGDPYAKISHVSFRQRSGGEWGAFFDYTARYGAMREAEDRVTLRGSLISTETGLAPKKHALFVKLTKEMNLDPLLDLPLLALSNGQTRRARVVKAILDQPELLLLDEPLTGLDPPSRKKLYEILHQLHREMSPRIIIGLRRGEEVPPWITHILDIQDGTAIQKRIGDLGSTHHLGATQQPATNKLHMTSQEQDGDLVVELKDVNVTYGTREILKNVNWQIRQGERWHLQGANGSGKTTLLALLTGDHPQSYVQDYLHLPCFSPSASSSPALQSRRNTPTAHLRRLIGVSSPEMFDAFPRRHPGMSVWEAVGTGFDGGFVPRTRGASAEARKIGGVGWVDVNDEEVDLDYALKSVSGEDATVDKDKKNEEMRRWRIARCWEVLECLGPAAWTDSSSAGFRDLPSSLPSEKTQVFASLFFASLSPGEQRLVLFMRALVARSPLVLLDEAWSGMDDAMIVAARRYLRGEVFGVDDHGQRVAKVGIDTAQAVVVITHWLEEVPWEGDEVKSFKLGEIFGKQSNP